MKAYPVITVVTPTLNNAKILTHFLENIEKQKYPKNKLEILIIDGGSKDNTVKIAKKYNTKIIPNPLVLAEAAVDIGLKKAKGDLIIILATDNIFKESNAFETIANVFQDPTIFAAFPKQDSTKSDTIFSKYQNVFTDPFNHFIYGYAANGRTFHKIYKTIEQNQIYDIYDYSSSRITPIIALAQGFIIRKDYIRSDKDKMDDIKPILQLIKKKKKIAYIHSLSLFHHTIRSLDHFIRKNIWATQNAIQNKNYGIAYRKKYLTKWQQIKIKVWPVYAFSIVFPSLRAVYGLLVDREINWVWHPLMCFFSAYASLRAVFMLQSKRRTDSTIRQ